MLEESQLQYKMTWNYKLSDFKSKSNSLPIKINQSIDKNKSRNSYFTTINLHQKTHNFLIQQKPLKTGKAKFPINS